MTKRKVLVVGPSNTKSRGGMATVIGGIRNSKILNLRYDIDIFPSYIDGNILVRLLYSLYGYLKFLTIYKKYDFFHIHTASFGSTFRKRIYLKTIKKAGKKAIVHIHGAKYLIFYAKLNQKKKKQVLEFLKSADMVIALSDEWKKSFEKTFGLKNCVSLSNGINTDEYVNAVCDINAHHNEFVMLGRIGKRKGSYDLINAVEKAVKVNPQIKIYLAGDGEISEVRKLVKQKKLEKNIEVVGWVDYNGKIELLKKSSILILPSYNEGLPMSVLEGMACGKAIISTTVGAIPEVVKVENGILVKPGDVEALADAIVKCSSNLDLLEYYSKNNIKKIKEQFSIETMHRKLLEFYDLMENNEYDTEYKEIE